MLLLGVLAAQAEAAGPAVDSDYDLLETEILTGTQASVTFSSLNSTYGADYQHLQIRALARNSTTTGAMVFRFNSDSGSNYASHYLFGDGSTVYSGGNASQTSITQYVTSKSTEAANAFAPSVWDILDPFETTKNTTTRSLGGTWLPEVILGSGFWNNTAALTDIEISVPSGNFVTGCRFSLYGLKASA